MKKVLSAVVVLLMVVVLATSCTGKEKTESKNENENNKKLKIITTIYPQYDFAKKIGGDKVDVEMLLKPGMETHSYEPSPKDINKIKNADIFIYVATENDFWVDRVFESFEDKKPDVIKLVDCVDTVAEEIVEGMEHHHDHEHGHHHDGKHESHEEHHDEEHDSHESHEEHHDGEHESHESHEEHHDEKHDSHESHEEHHDSEHESHESHEEHHDGEHENKYEIDEHVWTSPKNAMKIVSRISEKIIEKDMDNKAYYEENTNKYLKELSDLDKAYEDVISNSKRKTILFADRFPFRYLVKDYGLTYFAAFTGCSNETEADAATVVFLENKVKEEKLPVVFTIEMANGKMADAICEDTGAKKLMLHSCHNLTKDESEADEDYLSIMKSNLEKLKEALN